MYIYVSIISNIYIYIDKLKFMRTMMITVTVTINQ